MMYEKSRVVGKSPSDVAAFSADSSVKAEGTDEGFHTARQVSLADVFTSPSRVGVSNCCYTTGIKLEAAW